MPVVPAVSPQSNQQPAVPVTIAVPRFIDIDIADQLINSIIMVIGIVNPVHIPFRVCGLIGVPVIAWSAAQVKLEMNKRLKRLVAYCNMRRLRCRRYAEKSYH